MASADLRVWFGFGQNKFVQLMIRSWNSSGRFVRSLLTNHTNTDPNCNTNPNQHSNGNIFTRISLIPIKKLYRINEKNFSWRCIAEFKVGQFFTSLLM